MKKIFNIILSLLTIALFGFFIYTKVGNITEISSTMQFLLDYGAIILLGLFTFNNLLAKVMSIFFILFVIVVIVFIILIINPTFFAGASIITWSVII